MANERYMTIKEMAEMVGIDKQKVYRFIKKNHINEAHHEAHHEALQNHINEALFEALLNERFSAVL